MDPYDALPDAYRFHEHHPFEDSYFETNNGNSSDDPIQRVVDSVTLRDVQAFRNYSRDQAKQATTPCQPRKREIIDPNMLQTSLLLPKEDPFALYSVYTQSSAFAVHREVAAHDRPDLQVIELNEFSVDTLNPQSTHLSSLMRGDIIVVTGLARQVQARLKDIAIVSEKPFWQVGKYYVLPRQFYYQDRIVWTILQNCNNYFAAIYNSTRLALVFPNLDQSIQGGYQCGVLYEATAFCPSVQSGCFLKTIRNECERNLVDQRTRHFKKDQQLRITVIALETPSDESYDMIRKASTAFASYSTLEKSIESIAYSARFGLSTVLAITNHMTDFAEYVTVVDAAEPESNTVRLRLTLNKKFDELTMRKWNRNGEIRITTNDEQHFTGWIVDAVQPTSDCVKITLLVTTKTLEEQQRMTTLVNQQVTVKQCGVDTQLSAFPTVDELRNTFDINSNGFKVLQAICGGESIPRPQDTAVTTNYIGGFNLTKGQSQYVNIFMNKEVIGFSCNAAIGVGKTTMAVCAAICNSRHTDHNSTQLIVGVTNEATTSLVAAKMRVDPDNIIHGVRLLSETDRAKLKESQKTPYDYPVLWPVVFREKVLEADSKIAKGENIDNYRQAALMMDHLKKIGQFRQEELTSTEMKNAFEAEAAIGTLPSIVDLFVAAYKPRLIIGTTTTILCQLKNDWSCIKVETIQIDDASQLTRYKMIHLLFRFPNSRFAFIENIRQLPPYIGINHLKMFNPAAVRSLIDNVKKHQLPQVNVHKVIRCPVQITQILSECFFGNMLMSSSNAQCASPYTSDLQLASSCPLQIIEMSQNMRPQQHGAIFVNLRELNLALKLANFVYKRTNISDIAILCIYKEQVDILRKMATDQPFFIGTSGSFQGQEWSVVILLTAHITNLTAATFSDGTELMICGLGRAKNICFTIIEPDRKSPFWKNIFRLVGPTAITKASEILEKITALV